MTQSMRAPLLFCFVALLFLLEGTTEVWIFSGSWNTALGILNMALISAIMALGVNLQWGFAGLFNVGVMGFVALGGLATVLISMPPTTGAMGAGGWQILLGLVLGAATVLAAILVYQRMAAGKLRTLAMLALLIAGFFLFRAVFDAGVEGVEAINPAATGNLGGLNWGGAENYRAYGWLTVLSWPVGGVLAAGAAWIIGKTALGLRSDYLAIATLGIAEIIIAILKNEDWLSRGVKNVSGIPRPVPYEIDLQNDPGFVERAAALGLDPTLASTLYVKLGYAVLFTLVLIAILWLAQKALQSPWGRMMRAIRDNETAAEAMGKDVKARHLQIFILGAAVCGVAGAMMTTLDGQLTPGTYQPLRFTFLVWVMVIVGGSGNNFGAVLGGFVIWWLWVQVEPIGASLADGITFLTDQFAMAVETGDEAEATGFMAGLSAGLSRMAAHIAENVQHLRLFTMGLVMLFVLRFAPRGLLPEK